MVIYLIVGDDSMDFEYIPKTRAGERLGHIDSESKFYSFVEEFNITGVHWAEPSMISASYFRRILEEGSSVRARGYGRGNNTESDKYSTDMRDFYMPLLDHGAMWKLRNGNVICTAMPYGDKESIAESFQAMADRFNYPQSIRFQFLEDKYRYRLNGDHMIVIYCDNSQDEFDSACSDEEIRRKAFRHSSARLLRHQTVSNSFIRKRYVSEYAKRRARGRCQLCGTTAPFNDQYGHPYLEVHHVIWLADGGSDSIDNVVALCPNCPRKMHSLNLEEDVQTLLQVAASMK